MTYVDLVIVNLIERSCRKFQLLTGKTNVWLAVQFTNLSIIGYFVWAGVYFWSRGAAPRIFIAVFCSGLLYVLSQTVFKVPIEVYENATYRRVAKGYRNPRRVRDALLRISFLTLSLVLAYPVFLAYVTLRIHILLLGYSLIVLTMVILYLLACDPLPPSAGKKRSWSGLFGWRRWQSHPNVAELVRMRRGGPARRRRLTPVRRPRASPSCRTASRGPLPGRSCGRCEPATSG